MPLAGEKGMWTFSLLFTCGFLTGTEVTKRVPETMSDLYFKESPLTDRTAHSFRIDTQKENKHSNTFH